MASLENSTSGRTSEIIVKNELNYSFNNVKINVNSNPNLIIETLSNSQLNRSIKVNVSSPLVKKSQPNVSPNHNELSMQLRQKSINEKSIKLSDNVNPIVYPNCSKCGEQLDNLEEFRKRMDGFASNFLLDLICKICFQKRQRVSLEKLHYQLLPLEANEGTLEYLSTGGNAVKNGNRLEIDNDSFAARKIELKFSSSANVSENEITQEEPSLDLISNYEEDDVVYEENDAEVEHFIESDMEQKQEQSLELICDYEEDDVVYEENDGEVVEEFIESDMDTTENVEYIEDTTGAESLDDNKEIPKIKPRKFYCTVCNKSYPSRMSLQNHGIYKHNPKRMYTSKRKNKRSIRDTKYVCDVCDTSYTSLKNLQNHNYYKHANNNVKKTIKQRRQKSIQLDDDFVSLEAYGNTSYNCTTCGEIFGRLSMLIHHTTEQHTDDNCGKKGLLSFNCDICKTNYPSYKCLQNHIYYKHSKKRKQVDEPYRRIVKYGNDVLLIVPSEKPISDLKINVDEISESDEMDLDDVVDERKKGKAVSSAKHKCPLCIRTFRSQSLLKIHLKHVKHNTKTSIIYCALCKTNYKSLRLLKAHFYYKHSQNKDALIKEVSMEPDSKSTSTKHIVELKTIEVLIEPLQPPKEEVQIGMENNDDEFENLKFFCKFCCRPYKTKELQMAHEKYKHSNENDTSNGFNCSMCSKSYGSKKNLQSHISYKHKMKPNKQTFKCRVCTVEFEKRAKRQSHEKSVHLDDKTLRYPCPRADCQSTFPETRSLEAHLFGHDSYTPYVCEHCSKGFVRKQFLLNHLRTHVSKKQSYMCQHCDKVYRQKVNLKRHEEQHSGFKKVFCCDICDKPYSDIRDLKRHMCTHGEHKKEFECPSCPESFYVKYDLTKHKRKHHNK